MIDLIEKTKPQLTPKEQVEHLKRKGVKFEFYSEDEAVEYLSKNNNYFKIRAYRKSFEKYIGGEKDGTYIDLDFAMLKDLAIIDMRFRYVTSFEKYANIRLIS